MELYGENDEFTTLEIAGSCPSCRYVLPSLADSAAEYFGRGYFKCTKCEAKVDLWEVASGRAKAHPAVGHWSLASLGAATTSLILHLESGRYYERDIVDYGAPPGSKILGVTFTGQGGQNGAVTALAWHNNTVARRITGTKLRMLAIPLGEGPLPRTGKVAIGITWIRPGESDGWIYLSSALDSAADGELAPALVFAQAAVEVSLMPLVGRCLRLYASGDQVKEFMRDALTFGHALNVVLPNLCGRLGVPRIPDSIRGVLNVLRKKRNLIIHEGAAAANITPVNAAEGLAAAAMAFEYARFIAPRVASADAAKITNSTE